MSLVCSLTISATAQDGNREIGKLAGLRLIDGAQALAKLDRPYQGIDHSLEDICSVETSCLKSRTSYRVQLQSERCLLMIESL